MQNVINLAEYNIKKNEKKVLVPEKIRLCFSESQLIEMINAFAAHSDKKVRDVLDEYRHLFYIGYLDEKENVINPTSDFAK